MMAEQWFTNYNRTLRLLEMLNIPIRKAEVFSPEFAGDTLIIWSNEERVKAMGMKRCNGKTH